MDYILNITWFILQGSLTTVELFFITAVLATPLGFLVAMGEISKFKPLSKLLYLYTWIFRGTPLMLQIFFVYYGLPTFGIKFDSFTAASLAMVINYAAYLAEIFRAGMQSIDIGQIEASRALGMTYGQMMRHIILPQTIKRVLPPVSNEFISLIKDTALVSVIGMGDLLRAAKQVVTRDFNITAFIIAAVLYLLMTSVVVAAFRRLEARYSVYDG
ncbi:amino acid ABC transporter permease [Mahella sp.]|uniref:amino acid ABC transporter permease n=1 Tax=Mahella sp. TaxID=2798721 RepID=UPI0025C13EFA|nr:amino acid ABC transporter permease [Mahella sp.]MBZ4665878.1 polar amino acid transporter, inner rane subunit [Mahella sp.]